MTVDGFDPYGVPAEPVLTIDIRVDATGAEHALVNAGPVSPRLGESVRTAALRVAAEYVDRLAGGEPADVAGVRVRINSPDVRGYEAVIDRQGRLFVPVTSTTRPRQPEAGSLVAVAQEAFDQSSSRRAGSRRESADAHIGSTATVIDRTGTAWSPTFIDEFPVLDDLAPEANGSASSDDPVIPLPAAPPRPPRDRLVALLNPSAAESTDEAESPAQAQTPSSPELRPDARAHRDTPSRRDARAPRDTQAPRDASPAYRDARLQPVVTSRRGLRRIVIAIIAAAVLAAGGIVSIVVGLVSAGDLREDAPDAAGITAPSASPRPFPGIPPVGFSADPRWISEPAQAGQLLAWEDAAAYVTAARRLVVVDAMTGSPRWSASLPESGDLSPLARTSIDGQDVLATQVGRVLMWWRLDDGRSPGSLVLPSGAHTTFFGEAPLVGLSEDTVAILRDGQLSRITVPGDAYALAATTRGRVTAASSRGWWHLRPGVTPGLARPWEDTAPDDQAPQTTPSVVGYQGSSVLLLYPADRTGQLHVVAHTDREDDIRASFRGRVAAVEGVTQHWWPSPAQTWGVLGRTIVDVRRGRVSDLGDWTTTWVTQDHAYGTVAGRQVQTDAAGNRGSIPTGAAIPEAVTSAGAIVRSQSEAKPETGSLYLLPPS